MSDNTEAPPTEDNPTCVQVVPATPEFYRLIADFVHGCVAMGLEVAARNVVTNGQVTHIRAAAW